MTATLASALRDLFEPAPPRPQSRLIATWPDGRTFEVRKQGREWLWDSGRGSSHLSSVREHLAAEGATLERVPAEQETDK